jgi:hypothetical protein
MSGKVRLLLQKCSLFSYGFVTFYDPNAAMELIKKVGQAGCFVKQTNYIFIYR